MKWVVTYKRDLVNLSLATDILLEQKEFGEGTERWAVDAIFAASSGDSEGSVLSRTTIFSGELAKAKEYMAYLTASLEAIP